MCIAKALAAILLVPAVVFSATITVPDDYPEIQQAIVAAVNGDVVLVKQGTYVENIDFLGKAIIVRSESGPDVTIIDGGQPSNPDFGSAVIFQNGEGLDSILDGFTVTNGTGTLHAGMGHYDGGGISCWESSSPTLIDNRIVKNSCDAHGGGIFCFDYCSPVIDNCLVSTNAAHTGGGIAVYNYSSPSISQCTIEANTASQEGGGFMAGNFSSPQIDCCLIDGNTAKVYAGGMEFVYDCAPTIENSTIINNTAETNSCGGILIAHNCTGTIANNVIAWNTANGATWCGGGVEIGNACSVVMINNLVHGNSGVKGGGIDVYLDSSVVLLNNTVYGNTASISGGGLACRVNSSAVLVNSILWDDQSPLGPEIFIGSASYPSTLTIDHSCVKGGQGSVEVKAGCTLNWGTNMIDSDPLFLDPMNSDFHLTYDSACREMGNNATPSLPDWDFEGDPRIAWAGTVDIGADEFYTHLYVTGDKTPGGAIQGKFVGLPGTNPVGLFIGSGVLSTPVNTMWGEYWLQAPWFLFLLTTIPSNGILVIPLTLPVSIPAPYDVPMQALIGLNDDSLSNLYILEVR